MGGPFTVAGSHQYAEEGSYTVTVSVADDGGSTTYATGTNTVADAPLTADPLVLPLTTLLGNPTTLSFAFTDANAGGSTADFTVAPGHTTIDWGDASTSPGTVTGSGGSYHVTGSHTYAATGSYTVKVTVVDDGGSTTSATRTTIVAIACPSSGSINTRFHYSANGSSGSWSGTKSTSCQDGSISIGPQSMEGDLKVNPGATIKTGYDFTLPGNHTAYTAIVVNPQVVFQVRCVSGAAPSSSTFTVTMATQTYTVTGDAWTPSGDQSSPLVYQGSTSVPDLCSGGQVRLDRGGTFSATILLF